MYEFHDIFSNCFSPLCIVNIIPDVGEAKDFVRERPEMSFEDQTCPSQQHLTKHIELVKLLLKAYLTVIKQKTNRIEKSNHTKALVTSADLAINSGIFSFKSTFYVWVTPQNTLQSTLSLPQPLN